MSLRRVLRFVCVRVEGVAATQLMKLLDALEELDDVQKVDANFEMDDDAMEQA